MMQHLQSIPKENRYQPFNFPETDPAEYISNHPGIERRSERNRLDELYPARRLGYFRVTQRIMPSLSLLRDKIQAQLIYDTARIGNSTANFD